MGYFTKLKKTQMEIGWFYRVEGGRGKVLTNTKMSETTSFVHLNIPESKFFTYNFIKVTTIPKFSPPCIKYFKIKRFLTQTVTGVV